MAVWAQFTNVAIPIMHPVGKCIGDIASEEIIEFVFLLLSAILTYLPMKACKHGAIVPALKHDLNRDNTHQSHVMSSMPHACGERTKMDIGWVQ